MSNFDAFADFLMDGHVAIVTGGAQNIGEAIARTLSSAGAKVMIEEIPYFCLTISLISSC